MHLYESKVIVSFEHRPSKAKIALFLFKPSVCLTCEKPLNYSIFLFSIASTVAATRIFLLSRYRSKDAQIACLVCQLVPFSDRHINWYFAFKLSSNTNQFEKYECFVTLPPALTASACIQIAKKYLVLTH